MVLSLLLLQNNISGGVAQLGERLNGIQEVIGSIPTVSTTKKDRFGGLFLLVETVAICKGFCCMRQS